MFSKAYHILCNDYPRTSSALHLLFCPLFWFWFATACCMRHIKYSCYPDCFGKPQSSGNNSNRYKPEQSWTTECRRRQSKFERRNSLSAGSTSRKYKQQANSSFFQCLPLEVRQMIYAHVLNDETFLHLTIAGNRFVIPGCANEKCPTNPCQFHLEEDEESAIVRHTRCVSKYAGSWRIKDPWSYYGGVSLLRPSPLHFLPLLRTCRRM